MHKSIMIRYRVSAVTMVLLMSYDDMFHLILECSRVCVCVASELCA